MSLIDLTKRPDSVAFSPTTVFLRLPKETELQPGKSYAIQNGVTGTILYKGVDYPLTAGATRIDASAAGLTFAKLQAGLKFTVFNSDQTWGVGAALTLINLSGSDLTVRYPCMGVGVAIPADIPEGQCYITSGLSAAAPPWTVVYRLNGIDQYIPLQLGAKFLKTNGEWWRFDGARETRDFEPIFVGWVCDKNLDLANITNESLQAALSADDDGRSRPEIGKPIWVAVALLLAQTDRKENGPYIISPSGATKAARLNPYEAGNTILQNNSILQIKRGQYRGQMFVPIAPDLLPTGVGVERRIILGTTPHDWVTISASEVRQKELEAQTADLESEMAKLQTDLKAIAGTENFVEKDSIAIKQIESLESKVDGLGIPALKTSVSTLTDQYKTLDTTKANAADLAAAQAAIKALEDALAALPKTGATPEQIKAVEDRVKALEAALSTAENSKGILNQDVRSHFLVSGNLFGIEKKRLTSADITKKVERASYGSINPYSALNGTGTTSFDNGSHQWLILDFKTFRLWRIEVAYTNNNWGDRWIRRGSTNLMVLTKTTGTHTSIYKPKAAVGHEALNTISFIDDGPSNTAVSNWVVSISDPTEPASAPVIAGTALKVGDRFRFQTTDGVSALFTYQGTDAASGAWKATPVKATADSNIVLHTEIDPILDTHGTAIAALESQVTNVGNTITRRENRALEESDIDGRWHYFVQYSPLLSTAIWRKWEWIGENNAALLFDRVVTRDLSKAAAKYDETTKLYSLTFDGLQFQFATEGQLRFQMPGADSKFTNLRWEGFAADGTMIGNGGGSVATFDPQNPTFNTNIQANVGLAQGRAISKIRYVLTPITGSDVVFEVVL